MGGLDDDPARRAIAERGQAQLRTLALRDTVIRDPARGSGEADEKEVSAAAWDALAMLNTKQVPAVPLPGAMALLKTASAMPLSSGYAVFSWFIENAGQRLRDAGSVNTQLRPLFESTVLACQLTERICLADFEASENVIEARGPRGTGRDLIVGAEERTAALEFLKGWLSRQVAERVTICDPFFGPEEVEVLALISDILPGCEVTVLTSDGHNRNFSGDQSLEDVYARAWWRMRSVSPPDTLIVVVGVGEYGRSPIHDRYVLAGDAGLALGTSFNSIGDFRVSTMSELTASAAADARRAIEPFTNGRARRYGGDRVALRMFPLL